MKRIAVFPGSFDPITIGHESVVLRALPLFDEIIIAIGDNSQKKCMFTLEQRKKWIEKTFENYSNIKVDSYNALTVNYCIQKGARYILRGVRNNVDFQYEQNIALINNKLNASVETVFLLTEPEHAAVNSSFIREILSYKGEVKKFLPRNIRNEL